MLMMAYNTFMTMREGIAVHARIPSLLPAPV
jgi:hypothetical protein